MRDTLSLVPLLLLLVAAACGGSVVESANPVAAGSSPSGAAGGLSASAGAGGMSASSGTGGMSASAGSVGVDEQACASNSDCVLVPVGCCTCGNTTIADYKSINAEYMSQDAARCYGQGCGCPSEQPVPDNPTLYFVPTCRAGRCTAVDLRTTNVTTCKTAADCVLRSGASCCSGCGESPVAINSNEEPALEQLVCGSEPVACRNCAPVFTNLGVDCTATDRPPSDQALLPPPHCVVVSTVCTQANPCTL